MRLDNNVNFLTRIELAQLSKKQLSNLTRNDFKKPSAEDINGLSLERFKCIATKLPPHILNDLSDEKLKIFSAQALNAIPLNEVRHLSDRFIRCLPFATKLSFSNQALAALAPQLTEETLSGFPKQRKEFIATLLAKRAPEKAKSEGESVRDLFINTNDESDTQSREKSKKNSHILNQESSIPLKNARAARSADIVAATKVKAAIDSVQFEAQIAVHNKGSVYLTVRHYGTKEDGTRSALQHHHTDHFKARFSGHAQLRSSTISVDPITGNTLDDVLRVFHHMATGEGNPPRFYESIIEPKTGKQSRRIVQLVENSSGWQHEIIGDRQTLIRSKVKGLNKGNSLSEHRNRSANPWLELDWEVFDDRQRKINTGELTFQQLQEETILDIQNLQQSLGKA